MSLYGSSYYSAQAISPQRLERIASEVYGEMVDDEEFGGLPAFLQTRTARAERHEPAPRLIDVMPAPASRFRTTADQIADALVVYAKQPPQVRGNKVHLIATGKGWPLAVQKAAQIAMANDKALRMTASQTALPLTEGSWVPLTLEVMEYGA